MREQTIVHAKGEIVVLDALSGILRGKIEEKYAQLNQGRHVLALYNIEESAAVHNIRRGLLEAFEEIARRGYGRVVFATEVNEAGQRIRDVVFRLSQANAALPDSPVFMLSRNSVNGSRLASCRVGDSVEFKVPGGERYFKVTALIDLEGMTQSIGDAPDVALARFRLTGYAVVDTIRNLRSLVLPRPLDVEPAPTRPIPAGAPSPADQVRSAEPASPYWPQDWSNIVLGDDVAFSLGAQFFTQTTPDQETAIRSVRGVTLVEGIAGTGKTSVALGRLKFFANFRTGENAQEYGLSASDWPDFNTSNMVGYVLNSDLVQYLKKAADLLELTGMKIQAFEEFRDHELNARRLFGRPFRRSQERNANCLRTLAWLSTLDLKIAPQVALKLAAISVAKPDTPDARRVSDSRWREIESQYWRAGPLHARFQGLNRRLRLGTGRENQFRLQGIAQLFDREIRVTDAEIQSLAEVERRALREAILNVSLRAFRLLNPTELLTTAYSSDLNSAIERHLPESQDALREAVVQTCNRFSRNEITDDDVVTALCLSAISCDRFERDINDIPYLHSFSAAIAVFIDEYQDFNEQQLLLMSYRADRKYRQITIAGDPSQRLHRDGVPQAPNAVSLAGESPRRIFLDKNMRQTDALAKFSACIRQFTGDTSGVDHTGLRMPIYQFDQPIAFAEFAVEKITSLDRTATVAVICSSIESAMTWYEMIAPGLAGAFRNPIVSDRTRLTERYKTHFTTPLSAKGLEFDVVVIPNISEFVEHDPIALNGLYVAVSRARHALLLGLDRNAENNHVVGALIRKENGIVVNCSCELRG